MKVQAIKDLWDDTHNRLLVLTGTFGKVIGWQPAKQAHFAGGSINLPLMIVAFADGQTTYCNANEVATLDHN